MTMKNQHQHQQKDSEKLEWTSPTVTIINSKEDIEGKPSQATETSSFGAGS